MRDTRCIDTYPKRDLKWYSLFLPPPTTTHMLLADYSKEDGGHPAEGILTQLQHASSIHLLYDDITSLYDATAFNDLIKGLT